MNSNNEKKSKVPCQSSCGVSSQKTKSKGTSCSKVTIREEPKTRNVSTWTTKKEPCHGPCTQRKEPERFICKCGDCKCKVCKSKADAEYKNQGVAPQEVSKASSATIICPGPCAQGPEIKNGLPQKLPKKSLCTCVDCMCSVCDIQKNISKSKDTACKSTCTDSCTIEGKLKEQNISKATCTVTCAGSCTEMKDGVSQTLTAKPGCKCVDCVCSICYAELNANKPSGELPQEPPVKATCHCGNCLCSVCPVKEYAGELENKLSQQIPLKAVCQCTDCLCPVCESEKFAGELTQELPPKAVCQCTDCTCSVCEAKKYAGDLPQKLPDGFLCKCGDCLCYVCDDDRYAGRLKQQNAPPPDFSHIDDKDVCPAICAKGEEVQAEQPQKFTCKCKDCICYVCDDEKYEGRLQQQQAPPPTVQPFTVTKEACTCKSNKCGKCSKGFVCKCIDCICYVCDDDKRAGKVQENAPPLNLELLEKRRTESRTLAKETCACKSNKCGKCFRGFVCKCVDCICYVCDDDKRSAKVQDNAPPLDLELLAKRKIESETEAKATCACKSNKCGKCFREIKTEKSAPSVDLELLGRQKSETEPESELKPELEDQPESEPQPELEPEPESEFKDELEAQPELEPQPESEPGPESEAVPELEPQPEVEPQPELEPQPKLESQTKLEPQPVSEQSGKTAYCKCGRRTCNCHLYFEKYGPLPSTGENAPPATSLPVADEAPPPTVAEDESSPGAEEETPPPVAEEEAAPTVEEEEAAPVVEEEAPAVLEEDETPPTGEEGEAPPVAEEDEIPPAVEEEASAAVEEAAAVEEEAEPSSVVAEDEQLAPPPAEGEKEQRICKCKKNKCGRCGRAPPPSVVDEETVVEEDASLPVAKEEEPDEKDTPPPITEGEPAVAPPVEGKKKKKTCQCTSKKCKRCPKDASFTCKCPECICYVCDDPKYETRKQDDAPPLDMALLEKNKAESQAKASKKVCKCRKNRCGKCPKAGSLVPPPTLADGGRSESGVKHLVPPAKFECSCENCLCYVCDDEKYEGRLKQEPAPPINEKLLPKVCKRPCTGKCGNRLPCK